MKRFVYLSLSVWLAGCTPVENEPASADSRFSESEMTAAGTIRAGEIEDTVRELSSDDYEGRGPGTRADDKTQRFLVQKLEHLGFLPGAADGTWRQPFELVKVTAAQPDRWRFHYSSDTSEGDRELRQGTEFIVASGVQAGQAGVSEAELVFVGYGIRAPEYDWDDYKNADLTGKVLVVMNNDPDWSADLFAGDTRLYYGRWTYKYEMGAALGAAGVLIIHTDASAGYPWQVVQTSWSGPQFELPNEGEPTVQLKAWLTEKAAFELLSMTPFDLDELRSEARKRDFRPVPLGITTSLDLTVDITTSGSANILGLLPGSDPELADEVVIYTAHHDHLGIAETEDGADDLIYNGAMDNATGVASVLSIGKAFATLGKAPRRSVLLAFVGGEEQGLLGSNYYARHPTFAPGRIAANINMDGGQIAGRSHDVSYIGFGRSDIDQVALMVAEFQGRTITGDQDPSAGYFYRSDHFSLARIGVPSLNFRGGSDLLNGGKTVGEERRKTYIAQHYHQPSDEVGDDWDFAGVREDAQFGFYAGLLMANAHQMPKWVQGDEFEAARIAALSAVVEQFGP